MTTTHTAGRKGQAHKAKPVPKQTPGGRMLDGMREVMATLKAGGMTAVGKKFTVRRVTVTAIRPAAVSPTTATKLRASMGVSQAVFAAWVGVSPSTVQGWEQGMNPPAGAAARLLTEMARDPAHWRERIAADLAGATV